MLQWLFDTSMGPPGLSGSWPPWLTWLFHTSNLLTALCHFAVLAMVLAYGRFKGEGVTTRQLVLVSAFFPIAALSRLVRVIELWGSPYHLLTVMDTATALASMVSVYFLPPLIHNVLRLPSFEEIQRLNNELTRRVIEAELGRAQVVQQNQSLTDRLTAIERSLDTEGWTEEKKVALAEIRGMLAGRR